MRNVYSQPLSSLNSTSINTKYFASLAVPGTHVTVISLHNGIQIEYQLRSVEFVSVMNLHLQLRYALPDVCISLSHCMKLIAIKSQQNSF